MIAKIVNWSLTLLKVLLALIVLFLTQFIVVLVMNRNAINYREYEGLFSFAYTTIAANIMLILLRPKAKIFKNHKIANDKINPLEHFWLFVITMGMLGVVTIYFLIVEYISKLNEHVQTAVEQYNESVDRLEVVEATVIPNWDHVLYLISIVLIVPLVEELVFRGAILESFKKVTNKPVAVILSSVVFGLCHGISVHIIYALFCGIVLGTVYTVCNSIRASYIVHAIFNLFGSAIMIFMDSGLVSVTETFKLGVLGSITFTKFAAILPAVVAFVMLVKGRKLLTEQVQPQHVVEENADE